MALSSQTISEIKRKADNNIRLVNSTPSKQRMYDQFQDQLKGAVKQKAYSGQELLNTNDYKNQLYKEYNDNVKSLVEQKAYHGQQLSNPNEYKNELYKQYQQKPIDDLFNKQKEYLDSMYNQQKEQVAPQYQAKKNQADVVNKQNVHRLREVMASAGLTSSGENVTAQVAQNNQRQQSLNALNMQEQQELSGIETERSRALYDAYNNSQQLGYQQLRDRINDNRYNQQFEYQKNRDKVEDDRYQSETDWNRQREKMEYAWRKHTYNNMSKSERAQLDNLKYQFGEEMGWRLYEMEYQGNLQKGQYEAELDYYGAMDFLP